MCGASRSPCMLTLRCVLLCTWAPPRPATLTAVAKPRSFLRSWAMAADWLEVAAAESASSELDDWGGIVATCSIDHTSDEEWASIVAALPAPASPEIDEPSAVVLDDAASVLCPTRRRRGRPRRSPPATETSSVAVVPVSDVALGASGPTDLSRWWSSRVNDLAHCTERSLWARVAATRLADQMCATRVRGLSRLHPLLQGLDAASELGRRSSEIGADDGLLQLVSEHFFGADPARVSMSALAERYGVHRESILAALVRAAGAVCVAERGLVFDLAAAVVRGCGTNALLYVEAVQYDETPMITTTAHETTSLVECSVGQAGSLVATSTLGIRMRPTPTVTRILQTNATYGLVFRCRGRLSCIVGRSICHLQDLERCTADTVCEAQLRISATPLCARGFVDKLRVACADKAGCNAAAERGIAAARGPEWQNLCKACDLHIIQACYKWTYDLLEKNISGMIHCSLSLQLGSAMALWRRCLKEEILDTLHIKHGVPPDHCVRFRKHVLQLFLSHGRNMLTRRVLLSVLPNGDWSCDSTVEIYVGLGVFTCVDRDQLASLVSNGMAVALAWSRPWLYPRSRWVGAEMATDELGVAEACSRLLSRTWRRQLVALGTPWQGLGHAHDGSWHSGLSDDAPTVLDEASEGASWLAPCQNNNVAETGDRGGHAERNDKHRRLASAWLLGSECGTPLGQLILQRQSMECLRVLMTSQFELSSLEWEKRQQDRVLSATASGISLHGCRDYRVSVAAQGLLEKRCMEMLEVIFSRPQMWMALPALSFRFDFRATIFRVLSRLGACVTELYGHQHTLFPVRMFLLLKSKDHAAAILSTPPCVRGDWANNFIRKHPGLDTDECFFQLTAVAMLWPTDIGMTESRHASIRRVLESRSLQTHRLQFKHLSAEWTLQQSRLGARAAGSGIGRAPKYRRRAAGALVGARGDALVRGGRPARKDSA